MAETPLTPEAAADQSLPEPVAEAGQVPSPPLPTPESEAPAVQSYAMPQSYAQPLWSAEPPSPPSPSEPPAWDDQPGAPEPTAVPPLSASEPPASPVEPPPASEAETASVPAGVAATITVPPLPADAVGDGGEWDLLMDKLRAWLDGAGLQDRWNALGGPLRMIGLLLAAVVLLRLYSALLETLGDLPLLPRLLQLVGLVTLTRFALTRLVRSSERERILSIWSQRWNDFRGRD